MIKQVFICDCCKKTIPFAENGRKPGAIKHVSIPINSIYPLENQIKSCDVELCPDCYYKLYTVIRNHFHKFKHLSFTGDIQDDTEE